MTSSSDDSDSSSPAIVKQLKEAKRKETEEKREEKEKKKRKGISRRRIDCQKGMRKRIERRRKKEKKEETGIRETTEHHQQQCPNTETTRLSRSSHLDFRNRPCASLEDKRLSVTLLRYVGSVWPNDVYKAGVKHGQLGHDNHVMGRMRVAKGRVGVPDGFRGGVSWLSMRIGNQLRSGTTEFKVTHHLPDSQKFGNLKIMPVTEVNYGLDGAKAPPIQQYHGTHWNLLCITKRLLKMNTVIDVWNQQKRRLDISNRRRKWLANNGDGETPSVWLNPKMRKSGFPHWTTTTTITAKTETSRTG
jgi:hypothetical protein